MICALAQAVPVSLLGDVPFVLPSLRTLRTHKNTGKLGTGATSNVWKYQQISKKSIQAKCQYLTNLFCSTFLHTEETTLIPATVAIKQFSKRHFNAYTRESLIYSAFGNGSPFLLKAFGFLSNKFLNILVLEWANASYSDLFTFIHRNPRYKPTISKIRYIAANLVLGIEFMHKKEIVHQDIKVENVLVKYIQP